MDDKWFKQRQKIAGVTADEIAARLGRDRSLISRIYVGRQAMTLEQAQAFAEVLNVPLDEVLKRAGVLDEPKAQTFAPGFAESDAAPYRAAIPEMRKAQTVAEYFGGNRPGVDVWRVQSQSMLLAGYQLDDFILVDTHAADRAAPGDAVLAQVYDWNQGTARTVFRRFSPPVLVAASSLPEDAGVFIVDNNNVSIRGKVIASWRQA
ncbi:helix-turn-helix domain-containing protein [Oceaniglobus trochenteri]|uniref:helix-turn-helix domain-containing protein n=1 Tax=Oceaniglobus trochenteri TaxID=2763260 RepID=UPI001CFF7452|nr:helix-turn-helix transcriptional regulator [Oceaniglobus trochenteri]